MHTTFDHVGGMPTFLALAAAFYKRVEADQILRPMYPDELDEACERLALFLAQFFGGPTEYNDLRGAPMLRKRHLPFKIGQAERDIWLAHMLASMDEVGIAEPARSLMRTYFADTSAFLINSK